MKEQKTIFLTITEIAEIIHKGLFDEQMTENKPIRNLHIYAIAKMIANAQEEKIK